MEYAAKSGEKEKGEKEKEKKREIVKCSVGRSICK